MGTGSVLADTPPMSCLSHIANIGSIEMAACSTACSPPITSSPFSFTSPIASSGGSNQKPWYFVAVTDKATLRALADAHPYGKMLASAAVGIAVCGDPGISDWWVQDCSAATENILIAATGLGLGAVWIGCHGRPEREQAIREVLGIPKNIGVLSMLAIGHPGEEKEARTQFDAARVHHNRW